MSKRRRAERHLPTSDRGDIYPACPTRPPVGTVYIHNANGFFMTVTYSQLWPFRRLVEILTEQYGSYKWTNPHTIAWSCGLTLAGDSYSHLHSQNDVSDIPQWVLRSWQPTPSADHTNLLEKIVDEAISAEHRDWQPSDYFSSLIPRLADVYPTASEEPRRRTASPREPAAPRPVSARSLAPSDVIHVSVIATTLGVTAGQCRDALRRSGETKPSWGWQWQPGEISRVTSVIKEHLR